MDELANASDFYSQQSDSFAQLVLNLGIDPAIIQTTNANANSILQKSQKSPDTMDSSLKLISADLVNYKTLSSFRKAAHSALLSSVSSDSAKTLSPLLQYLATEDSIDLTDKDETLNSVKNFKSNGSADITKQIDELTKINQALRQKIKNTQQLCGIVLPESGDDEDAEEEEEQSQTVDEAEGEGESEGEAEGEGEGEGENEGEGEEAEEESENVEADERDYGNAIATPNVASRLTDGANKEPDANTPVTYLQLALSRRSGFPIRKQGKKPNAASIPPSPQQSQQRIPPPPPSTQAKNAPAASAETSTAPPPKPTAPKKLLKSQLEEKINDILKSKVSFDKTCEDGGLPNETLEEYFMTYLNMRYGMRKLITESNHSILYYTNAYRSDSNRVAVFAQMLLNEIDEDFPAAQQQLEGAIIEYITAYVRGQLNSKSEAAVQQKMKMIISGREGVEADTAICLARFLFGDGLTEEDCFDPLAEHPPTSRFPYPPLIPIPPRTRRKPSSSSSAASSGNALSTASSAVMTAEEQSVNASASRFDVTSEGQRHVAALVRSIHHYLDEDKARLEQVKANREKERYTPRRTKKELSSREHPTIALSVLTKLILEASLLWHFEYLTPFRMLFQSPNVCLTDQDGQPTGAVDVAGLTELVRLLLTRLRTYRREKDARIARLRKDRQRANEGRQKAGAADAASEEDNDEESDDSDSETTGTQTEEEAPVTMDDVERFLRSVPLRNTTRFTFTDCVRAFSKQIDELHRLTFELSIE